MLQDKVSRIQVAIKLITNSVGCHLIIHQISFESREVMVMVKWIKTKSLKENKH